MAIEKTWPAVAPQALTADGTLDGTVQIQNAWLFRVGQEVLLKSNTQNPRVLKVKGIDFPSTIKLGLTGFGINQLEDLSNFLVSENSTISANKQGRPHISPDEVMRAVFDEEPSVALRSVLVDRYGNYVGQDPSSPFYVQLTDGSVNIGTVNAELEVQLSHKDNDPDSGDVHDSVRIGDGVEELEVNPDGSLNVNIVPSNTDTLITTTYNEVASIPGSNLTLIHSYTAPASKLSFLHKIFVSGSNIAKYIIKRNGSVIDQARTYFGGSLNHKFNFSDSSRGLLLNVGDVVTVQVEHFRPEVGDFNARIQALEL